MSRPGDRLGKNYTIVEEDEFLAKIHRLIGEPRIWDEIKKTFDHFLSRDPEKAGVPLEEPGYFTRDLLLRRQHESVWIIYQVDHAKRCVFLIDAKRAAG